MTTQLSDDFPLMPEVECDTRADSFNFGQPLPNCPPVLVAFGMHPVLDKAATTAAGHEVYRDVEFVKIVIPGDRNAMFMQPAEQVYRQRFPKAYEAFKRRDTQARVGMPIEQWPPISKAMVLTLKAVHIDTVEALAAVHDGNIDRIGGNGRELRAKAQAWLADASNGAEAIRLAAEKQALQDQISGLQAQISAMQEVFSERMAEANQKGAKADASGAVADAAAAARKPRTPSQATATA